MNRRTLVPVLTLAAMLVASSVLPATAGAAAGDKTSKKAAAKATDAKAAEAKAAETKPAADAKAPMTEAEHQAMMAEMMKLAAPAEEHKALTPMVGTWKTTTRMWMGQAEPEVSEGTCERSWAMGGRYLVSKYAGDFQGMPFEGMEILGYDRMKKEYISTWIDNMGTSFYLSKGGSMDPTTKTLTKKGTMPDPTGAGEFVMREVTTFVDDNTHTFTMFAVRDGKETKEMEITYTRVK